MNSFYLLFCCVLLFGIESEAERVFPKVENQNGRKNLRLAIDGRDYNLELRPRTVFAENFVIRSIEDDKFVDEDLASVGLTGRIYRDTTNQASLYIDDNNDELHVEGLLGNGYRIQPAIEKISRRNTHAPHDVYPVNEKSMRAPKNSAFVLPQKKRAIKMVPTPKAVEMELVVVVDKVGGSYFHNKSDLVRYLGIFINAVNIPYSTLKDPTVRITLSGVIQNTRTDMEPYIIPNLQDKTTLRTNALEDFRIYMEDKYKNWKYDAAILLTGLGLVAGDGDNTGGVSYVGRACGASRYGLCRDTPPAVYSGVRVVIHELAHLFSIQHDGDESIEAFSGHPSSESCPSSMEYFMSGRMGRPKYYTFSPCSVSQLRYFVSTDLGACLSQHNVEHLKTDPRLPGQVISFLEICQRRLLSDPKDSIYVQTVSKHLGACQIGCCIRNGKCTVVYKLDGTPCGNNKICQGNICVSN